MPRGNLSRLLAVNLFSVPYLEQTHGVPWYFSKRGMKEKKLFIFDLDGTLVDAYQAIEKSLNFTREKLGYSIVSFQKVKRNVGRGDRHFVEMFFPGGNKEEALKIYRAHHKETLLKYSQLRPYAKMLLYILKRRKKILAIASNRPKYYTDILLDKFLIKKYFNGVYCGDELDSLKPDPKILNTILERFKVKKEDAVYSGDMDIDLETAERAGIDAVFVKGGSSPLAAVKEYKNKKIVSSLKDILEMYN